MSHMDGRNAHLFSDESGERFFVGKLRVGVLFIVDSYTTRNDTFSPACTTENNNIFILSWSSALKDEMSYRDVLAKKFMIYSHVIHFIL